MKGRWVIYMDMGRFSGIFHDVQMEVLEGENHLEIPSGKHTKSY